MNEDIPQLELDRCWLHQLVQTMIAWDDVELEDSDYSSSMDLDSELEPGVFEHEEQEEIDLIMRVQEMPEQNLDYAEFPHLILNEHPLLKQTPYL